VALEVCVVEEFERVTTPADYLVAAGEVETSSKKAINVFL